MEDKMLLRYWSNLPGGIATVLSIVLSLSVVPCARAQHGSEGTVSVTVLDSSGSVVQGAQLELRDLATNDVRNSETQEKGTHTFVNLSLGKYKLTVTKTGFQTQVFTDVVVQAAQTTNISATLRVGAINETIQVNTDQAPIVETTSSSIGTTVDMKAIEDLPLQGRDLSVLSTLAPGYTGNFYDGGGTWNGLPTIAQGSNIDGVIGSPSRMKFGGNGPGAAPAVQARVEDIEEMTVQTDQLDLNQGYGTSNMQVNFVTRRGTSRFHGRVYDDFRNAALNANSWLNDTLTAINPSSPQRKNPLILNDFGGSLGGPIIRDKLFFFGSFSMSKQPGSFSASQWVFTPAAQNGDFTYVDTNGNTQVVNVLQAAASCGAACGGALPSTVNSQTSATLQAVNGVLNKGTLSAVSDPNVQQLTWQVASPQTNYFPAVRVDYVASPKMRYYVAWNETKTIQSNFNAPNLPGTAFAGTGASNKFLNYTAALGFDYTVSPTLINSFRGGFLYNFSGFGFDGKPPASGQAQIAWNLPNLQSFPGVGHPSTEGMNGTNFQIPTGSYYPLFNASDTVTWQHKDHTLNLGVSWWREQNHYYNGVLGYPGIQLGSNTGTGPGFATGDPAVAAFNSTTLPNATSVATQEAESLYAILTGRINSVGGQYPYSPSSNQYIHSLGAYNLDELTKAWGVFAQDSYRIRPTLTLNYGLRWDFTWADRDLTNLYHSATPTNIFGPSGVGNLFNPGSLNGTMNPQLVQNSQPYNNWFVAPQPAFGIAWNPRGGDGALGRLLGGDKTVIRAGFSFRTFTEPQQYVWNEASDYGSFYYQGFFLNAVKGANQAGAFQPGSLFLGSPLPAYGFKPQSFQKVESESDFTFLGGNVPGVNGIDPNLKQPYTESWNLGIQHQLGENRALEVRYIGNRTLRQWVAIDTNEVNIFENGFLAQFKAAQNNLNINNASGNASFQGSFANHGLPGQQPLPIFNAAFAGEPAGADGSAADFTNGGFTGFVSTGQAGLFANTLAGAPYICNMVGSAALTPCQTNLGITTAGAGYPINFFQANPYAQGAGFATTELVAEGYSNYNGLQVDFRQRQWHGLQFDANYTWSHTLGISSPNNWQGQSNIFTLRNMRLSYGPTLFDIRHAININGSYDLPFGRGKQFLNDSNAVLDRVVGGWTIGTILGYQAGAPFLLEGGNNTFNANLNNDGYGDGGVELHGVTPSQLQSAVGVYRIPGQAAVSFLNPKYLAPGGGANPQFITANTTPGTIGQLVYLYGPHYFNDDLAITKVVPIRENIKFSLQAEMLNAFNHPNFQPGAANGTTYFSFANGFSPNVQQQGFAIGGISPNYSPVSPNQGARVIELRANIEF
ncbi:MAG: carboxypeptidase regulatory-like domain-containing protein [Acidobacteria bacterium]|nr:MAG: carboxypeptidase regulatory-like domain-containing protein [Acidobacteriota bacterium]